MTSRLFETLEYVIYLLHNVINCHSEKIEVHNRHRIGHKFHMNKPYLNGSVPLGLRIFLQRPYLEVE